MGARAIKRAFRNNPFALLQNERRRQAGRQGPARYPPWFYAASLYPPGPAPLPRVVPSEVGHFQPPEAESKCEQRQLASVFSPKRTKERELHVKHVKNAPKIRYPEDALRREFYATHPFELSRPVNLVETEQSLLEGPSGRGTVDGESVVNRAMELISAEGGSHPLHIAYNMALAEFYEKRAGQELELEKAKAQRAHERKAAREALKRSGDQQKVDAEKAHQEEIPHDVTWFKQRETEEFKKNAQYVNEVVAE
ncbi:mitochondrial ribosomal small subunit component [Phlyctochytrium bullatum]|nr:mitochondrial ribosomal small subunit component [Phlyctochytrium bullatum]